MRAPVIAARARAWTVAGLPSAVALAGLGLALRRPTADVLLAGHLVGDVAATLACAAVAALILARLPGHPVGRTFAAIAAFDAASAATTGLDGSGLAIGRSTPVFWLDALTWIPGLILTLAVLPLVFPNGASTRWQRRLLRADLAVILVDVVAAATGSRLATGEHTAISNPLAVPGADTLSRLGLAVSAVLIAAGVITLARRLVTAPAPLRRQIAPFVLAGVLALAAALAADSLGEVGVILQDTAVLAVPAAAGLAVLRYRLYDLEVVVRRTAVWVLASAVLVAGYVVVVQVTASAARLGQRPASVIATAAVALAFTPVRAAASRLVSRLLYGDVDDPYLALARTSRLLAQASDPASALEQATASLTEALRAPAVRIRLDGRVVAGTDDERPSALTLPLSLPRAPGGSLRAGALEVVARSPGEAFSRADAQLVADLAAPLTAALAAVVAADDLEAARADLVRSREEERRRLRGELHDDIGPALAAITVQAATAVRRLERDDPAAAREVLDQLATTARRAASDLRAVVDALRPRVLDEVGLAAAITTLAASLSGDGLVISTSIPALPPLPAATELAVYRVVAEALTNVSKHAGATSVTVTLTLHAGVLGVECVDDGVGPSHGPGAAAVLNGAAGVGLPSMRARVAELGGTLTLSPCADPAHPGRGTRLTARLPAAGPATAGAR